MPELFLYVSGITNLHDARLTVKLGAHAVGFTFFEHDSRYVSPEHAANIGSHLPEFVSKIGLFVNASQRYILDVARHANLSAVQLYGTEGPDDLVSYDISVIKAFRVHPAFEVERMKNFVVDAFLLDALSEGSFGEGAGLFHWNVAVKAKEYGRVILSGGLDPNNVAAAVQFVQPYGVEVNAGVESSPGKKDPDKLRDFIANARNASVVSAMEGYVG
ncbi:MAG: phosphoribosylanthranilate isomerase [Ignavibacteriales bacterium]|nr:phosphoribosylanthranilate isomerase [Ignavibacteriales bacterium]